MIRHFRRSGNDIRMDLDAIEVEIILDLRDGVRASLSDPDVADPALHRLFPPAVRGDDLEDADARSAFYDDLLTSRLAGLDALGEIVERAEHRRGGRRRTVLVDDEPALVLGVINDLRLALAARIGMDHVEQRDLDADDPMRQAIAILDHLAWMQEQLVRLIDPAIADGDEDLLDDLEDSD